MSERITMLRWQQTAGLTKDYLDLVRPIVEFDPFLKKRIEKHGSKGRQ